MVGYRDRSNTRGYPSPMGAGTVKKGLLRENYIAEGHSCHQSQYRKRAKRKTKCLNLSSLLSAPSPSSVSHQVEITLQERLG